MMHSRHGSQCEALLVNPADHPLSSSNGSQSNGGSSQHSEVTSPFMTTADLMSAVQMSQPTQDAANSYSAEWERLFGQHHFKEAVRQLGVDGELRSSRFRSLCWKLYLQVLPWDRDQWLSRTREWRNKYRDLKQTLIVNPRKSMDSSDLSVNNPLSQENESPWNQFFQDNELRVTIKQDVIRTYPKIDFYHTDMVRSFMVDILFVFAKVKPFVAYRQGMHELLAPLIFVLHCDHQAYLHACEIDTIGDVLHEVMDPEYLEHDAYAMFYHIMETVEPWYVSKEISPRVRLNDLLGARPFTKFQDLHPSNVIVTKLTRIQDYLLKKIDPELHEHLTTMDIAPQIYGIRWVRLLFGREFPMQDLLMLWDAIFADGISFDLVDYIFVAMLLYIRDAMLTSDYASCLQLLMRFPPVGDVHYFITKAVYLREPSQHPLPPVYIHHKMPPADTATSNKATRRGQRSNMMGAFSGFNWKMNSGRPKSLVVGKSSNVSRSSSEPMNLITDSSPVLVAGPAVPPRKGSTASLSQLEGVEPHTPLDSSSVRSDSAATVSRPGRTDAASLPSNRRFSSLPRSKQKPRRSQDRGVDYDVAILLARLNDMDAMCRKCADHMDTHIVKLQSEMLCQDLERADELLLSLAGLKQVRDVLKGTLKPSSLFDVEDIHIRDNHYKPDTAPCGSVVSSGATSQDNGQPSTYDVATPDLLSDTDLQTPDTDDMIGRDDDPMAMSVSSEPIIRQERAGSGIKGDEMPREFVPSSRKPPMGVKSVEMSERQHGFKRRASSKDSSVTGGSSMDESMGSVDRTSQWDTEDGEMCTNGREDQRHCDSHQIQSASHQTQSASHQTQSASHQTQSASHQIPSVSYQAQSTSLHTPIPDQTVQHPLDNNQNEPYVVLSANDRPARCPHKPVTGKEGPQRPAAGLEVPHAAPRGINKVPPANRPLRDKSPMSKLADMFRGLPKF